MYILPTRQQLLGAGSPFGMTVEGTPCGVENTEWLRTEPDAVIFIPSIREEFGNEHVHVEEVPKWGCLFAVWQQSSVESAGNERVMYSRSTDGNIWETPKMLAGVRPGKDKEDCIASFPFMTVAPSGRIYVFYTRHTSPQKENVPWGYMTGILTCTFTDDCGSTWSEPVDIKRRVTHWDVPGKEEPQIFLSVQSPVHLKDGRCLISYAKTISEEFFPRREVGCLVREYRAYFAIIENFSDSPRPEDFEITWLPDDEEGLWIKGAEPYMDITDEPFTVELPNGWLFVSLRTMQGAIYYSVSEDKGHTWRDPKPLKFADGDIFVNPVVTPFLCDCKDGRYMQLYYGRCGELTEMYTYRDKLYRAFGYFSPADEQPIRFDKKGELYMAVDVAAGSRMHIAPEVNVEASFTLFRNVPMLWYGDRKHYVLGKRV